MNTDDQKKFKSPPLSYWMASTPTTGYPSLDHDINVDVAIVGGGITGITCAYFLKKEGLNIAILEANHIAQGTTGHTTAKVTSQHELIYTKIQQQFGIDYAKQYALANELAIREIKKVIEENQIECDFESQNAFVYTQQDKYLQSIWDEAKLASELGIKASHVESIPFNIPIKGAVCFDNQAQFHPRKYLLGLINKLTNKSCQIYEQTRIVGIKEDNPYILTTDNGKRINAERVIIASHYPFYNKKHMYYAKIYQERSYVTAIKAKEKYPGGMYISVEEPGRSLRYQNNNNEELILVGGEHHKTGQGEDMVKHYETLINFANEIFNVEDIPYRWSTQDCMTLDGIPYAGKYSSTTPNLYVATGFGKWGMTNSMASAILIRDLITNKDNPWQEVYSPARHTTFTSAANFTVQNINVADQLVSGKISPLPNDIEIERGKAKVIKKDGNRVGVYKDEQGDIYQVNTTCTHMGCEINWNSAERSWDCPCHGSRFNYKGEIIEGPTVNPLEFSNEVNTLEKVIKDDY